MARAKQDVMKGFDQERIRPIETWADKFDEKRELVRGLTEERDNAEFKLAEVMHANAAQLDKQEGPRGEKLLVYKRGDYKVVLKQGAEKVNVKIKEASKGAEPESE